jgi:hypothetical protein
MMRISLAGPLCSETKKIFSVCVWSTTFSFIVHFHRINKRDGHFFLKSGSKSGFVQAMFNAPRSRQSLEDNDSNEANVARLRIGLVVE